MDLREISDHPIRRHPWETARACYFRTVLKTVSDHRVAAILDVGSGDGWLSQELRRSFPKAHLTCWDSAYTDHFDPASDRLQNGLVSYTTERPNSRFDLILLMDLLEHLDDDQEFMTSLVERNTNDDAVFLVCVPAWNFLYSSHDATFSHRRRYAPSELTDLLHDAGLEILHDGDMFQSLLAPRLLRVFWEVLTGTSRIKRQPQPLKWSHSEALAHLIEIHFIAESFLNRVLRRVGIRLPGLSTWALCRKTPRL